MDNERLVNSPQTHYQQHHGLSCFFLSRTTSTPDQRWLNPQWCKRKYLVFVENDSKTVCVRVCVCVRCSYSSTITRWLRREKYLQKNGVAPQDGGRGCAHTTAALLEQTHTHLSSGVLVAQGRLQGSKPLPDASRPEAAGRNAPSVYVTGVLHVAYLRLHCPGIVKGKKGRHRMSYHTIPL